VATIQAEQDETIRLDHPDVLVIENGPGHREDLRAGRAIARISKTDLRLRRHSHIAT
jgi:hypothetical protein